MACSRLGETYVSLQLDLAHPKPIAVKTVSYSEPQEGCDYWQQAESSGWVQPPSHKQATAPVTPQSSPTSAFTHPVPCGSPRSRAH